MSKIESIEVVEVVEVAGAETKAKPKATKLTIFTAKVVAPVEQQYITLGDKYETIKAEFTALIDSVKDIEITEAYLDTATQIQKQVNSMWNEIETARKQYHNYIDEVFYKPIADKLEREIKVKFNVWEDTFKKSKLEVERELLEKRIKSVGEWFAKQVDESGLGFIDIDQAMKFGNVKVTRKNKHTEIATKCNEFITKVKSDILVLGENHGDEEKAEYLKCFNVLESINKVKERQQELDAVKQIQEVVDVPLIAVVPAPVDNGRLTRIWSITGNREQLMTLARHIVDNDMDYKVRKDLM